MRISDWSSDVCSSDLLSDILADTLTPSPSPDARRDAMRDFIAGRLLEPLGMTSLTPEFDAKGTMIGGSVLHPAAPGYADFGEFLRHHSGVDGTRLLPESCLPLLLTPSPHDAGPCGT